MPSEYYQEDSCINHETKPHIVLVYVANFFAFVFPFGSEHSSYHGAWPLHDIAITNIVWRIAFKRGVGVGVV